MKWRPGRRLATVLAGLTMAATLACSGSDPIEPSNGLVTLQLSASPAYTGPFQWARLQVDQVTVRPFDPLANSYLGIPIGLLAAPVSASLRSGAATVLITVPLRAGTYRLDKVRLSTYQLNVANTAPIGAQAVCDNGVLTEARPDGITIVDYSLSAQPPSFQVPQGVGTPVTLTIDGPGLVTALENQPYACGGTFPILTPQQVAPLLDVN
jgi:hypothetical protein